MSKHRELPLAIGISVLIMIAASAAALANRQVASGPDRSVSQSSG